MDAAQTTILFRLLFQHLGKAHNRAWRDFKWHYRAKRNFPKRCENTRCQKKIYVHRTDITSHQHDTLTFDHIIPRWLIEELELIDLIFDEDNYMLLCHTCNTQKANTMPKLTEISPVLLIKFQKAIDERNTAVYI